MTFAKDRDGKTEIWGTITRPTKFDPLKKYPVIVRLTKLIELRNA
jgi:dipeptidyl aminopeptidase/acylaminoacyl peptidase